MEIIKKLFYRRFSKEEYKQLRTILSEETKAMLKRPQYIIGNILITSLSFYFLVRALGLESVREFKWPSTADVVGIVVSTAIGICIFWLVLKLLFKVKGSDLRFIVIFWGLWMLAFSLLTTAKPHSKVNWEFAIYATMTLFGWLCCTASIKEHFCEKILMSQKDEKQADISYGRDSQ